MKLNEKTYDAIFLAQSYDILFNFEDGVYACPLIRDQYHHEIYINYNDKFERQEFRFEFHNEPHGVYYFHKNIESNLWEFTVGNVGDHQQFTHANEILNKIILHSKEFE